MKICYDLTAFLGMPWNILRHPWYILIVSSTIFYMLYHSPRQIKCTHLYLLIKYPGKLFILFERISKLLPAISRPAIAKMRWDISPPWWRHQMETFSALLAICARNSSVTGEFPTQGQWRGAVMFSLIYDWINGWVNNCEAGDLRRHHAHYDVTVMNQAYNPWRCLMWKITSERFVFKLVPIQGTLGLYSLRGKTSYHQISWSLEAARLDVIMIVSLRNLTGISVALLPIVSVKL